MANAATAKSAKAAPVPAAGSEARMPFMLHLKELRDRLIRSVIAIVITTGLSIFFLGERAIELLKRPAPIGTIFVVITPTEYIGVWFKVSLWIGILAAMPVLVYQFLAYIAPGMTSKEKKFIFTMMPFITIMFVFGVAFSYFFALPAILNFLYQFGEGSVEIQIRLSAHIDLVTRLMLATGLVFETPLIIMALAKIGVVSPEWLAKRRKIWLVAAFIIGAMITPDPMPQTQIMVAIPLILLLELGILLARFVYKKKRDNPPASSGAA